MIRIVLIMMRIFGVVAIYCGMGTGGVMEVRMIFVAKREEFHYCFCNLK